MNNIDRADINGISKNGAEAALLISKGVDTCQTRQAALHHSQQHISSSLSDTKVQKISIQTTKSVIFFAQKCIFFQLKNGEGRVISSCVLGRDIIGTGSVGTSAPLRNWKRRSRGPGQRAENDKAQPRRWERGGGPAYRRRARGMDGAGGKRPPEPTGATRNPTETPNPKPNNPSM